VGEQEESETPKEPNEDAEDADSDVEDEEDSDEDHNYDSSIAPPVSIKQNKPDTIRRAQSEDALTKEPKKNSVPSTIPPELNIQMASLTSPNQTSNKRASKQPSIPKDTSPVASNATPSPNPSISNGTALLNNTSFIQAPPSQTGTISQITNTSNSQVTLPKLNKKLSKSTESQAEFMVSPQAMQYVGIFYGIVGKKEKEGFLKMQKKGKLRSYFKTRWCTLDMNFFYVFKKKKDKVPAVVVQLVGNSVTDVDDKKNFYFRINTPQKLYMFLGENKDHRDGWSQAITKVINTPREPSEAQEETEEEEENLQNLELTSNSKFIDVSIQGENIVLCHFGTSIDNTQTNRAKRGEIVYYEILIEEIDDTTRGNIIIGFAPGNFASNKMPGEETRSYGYSSRNGKMYSNGVYLSEGPTFSKGDIIGCGYIKQSKEMFFTKNGENLGSRFTNVARNLFPTIGMDSMSTVVVNLGKRDFIFKVESLIKPPEADTRSFLVNKSTVSLASPDQRYVRINFKKDNNSSTKAMIVDKGITTRNLIEMALTKYLFKDTGNFTLYTVRSTKEELLSLGEQPLSKSSVDTKFYSFSLVEEAFNPNPLPDTAKNFRKTDNKSDLRAISIPCKVIIADNKGVQTEKSIQVALFGCKNLNQVKDHIFDQLKLQNRDKLGLAFIFPESEITHELGCYTVLQYLQTASSIQCQITPKQ